MKQDLNWRGNRVGENEWFDCTVPGNIQRDYGIFKNFENIYYGKNVERYEDFEDDTWIYKAEFKADAKENEKLFFVAEGIEYECEISINRKLLCKHEGMFTKIEIDITDEIRENNTIEIKILPHPNSKLRHGYGRDEADHCVKPPVEYGWD